VGGDHLRGDSINAVKENGYALLGMVLWREEAIPTMVHSLSFLLSLSLL